MGSLLIRDALVIDGTGRPPFPADVVVDGGVIAQMGRHLTRPPGSDVLRADGAVLAPGIRGPAHARRFHRAGDAPRARADLAGGHHPAGRQLRVLAVPGRRGRTSLLRDYTAFLDGGLPWGNVADRGGVLRLRSRPLPLAGNLACQVGHGTIRIAVMGFDPGPPDAEQLTEMRRLARDSVAAGAAAISSGLTYAPASSAGLDELVAVAEAGEIGRGAVLLDPPAQRGDRRHARPWTRRSPSAPGPGCRSSSATSRSWGPGTGRRSTRSSRGSTAPPRRWTSRWTSTRTRRAAPPWPSSCRAGPPRAARRRCSDAWPTRRPGPGSTVRSRPRTRPISPGDCGPSSRRTSSWPPCPTRSSAGTSASRWPRSPEREGTDPATAALEMIRRWGGGGHDHRARAIGAEPAAHHGSSADRHRQ